MNSKITIERTKDNAKMLRLMADKDYLKAMAAREAFAAFITQPVQQVIESAPVIGNLYSTATYDYGTPPSIPLAPLFDIKQPDFIKVWAQPRAGGLATSANMDVSELMVMTYALESAVSFRLDYVRAARVDVVAAYLERMAQEVLYKQEVNSWAILAASVMQSTYNNAATNASAFQVLRSQTQGTVIPQDVNRLITLMQRVNSSWVGGTPQGASRAITTLVGSPEFMEQIRNMAFQNVNTNGTAIPSSDKFRDQIYDAGLNPSFFGMELVTVYDMGRNYPYNIIAANYAGSNAYQGYGQTGTAVFSPGSEQLVVGVDRRQKFLLRLVESNPDDGSTFSVQADNQWTNRSETIGFWGKCREGRVAVDGRNSVGILF